MVDALKRPASASQAEVRALLILDQLPGVGPRRIRALVVTFGSAECVLAEPEGLFGQVARSAVADSRGRPSSSSRARSPKLGHSTPRARRALRASHPTHPADVAIPRSARAIERS